jgi:hypothetical protein
VAKHGTPTIAVEHPPWCNLSYRESNDHDPHTSHRERVAEDFPSDLSIEAHLLRPNQPADPSQPYAALANLEFHFRGEKVASFLMTFGQVRRLDEALYRLVKLGELT